MVSIVDNWSAHKSDHLCDWLASRDLQLEFGLPYSSDLNRIELCWAKVKAKLRAAKARTLLAAVRNALRSVSQQILSIGFIIVAIR